MSESRRKRLVRIGGGSSGYMILRGLKEYPWDITAVVNMFDSGGSSGVLRDELGILPPGDVRRALAALALGERGEILRELFNYRFKSNGSVSGHNFGNLFVAALSDIYGGDAQAIEKASIALGISGRVLPVSTDLAHIHAVLSDGTEIEGETNIDIPQHDGALSIEKVFLKPQPHIYAQAAAAIREADVIVIGPGDLYTSIIPNLLVGGMRDALRESNAIKIVVTNLMTKWGETHGFVASDMVREVLAYSGLLKFDYALCNTSVPSVELLAQYAEQKQFPMVCDEKVSQYASYVVKGDFASESEVVRHDSHKLARAVADVVVP